MSCCIEEDNSTEQQTQLACINDTIPVPDFAKHAPIAHNAEQLQTILSMGECLKVVPIHQRWACEKQ